MDMTILSVVPTLMLLLSQFLDFVQATKSESLKDTSDISAVTVAAVVCISLLVVVFVLSLCGGCTPMEVGSDDHAASGGHKSYSQYSGVATDVNTHVMTSGTTLPNDPYQPNEQALPYPVHPQTDHNFRGYQAPTQQGYQASGASTQGYQEAGAHRHFSESEPPPPNYYQAMQSGTPGQQPTAPAQQYSW